MYSIFFNNKSDNTTIDRWQMTDPLSVWRRKILKYDGGFTIFGAIYMFNQMVTVLEIFFNTFKEYYQSKSI